MNLLYLINRYPGASHSFIRREIRAHEALGQAVVRVTIRPAWDDIPDVEDQREARQTLVLLGQGKKALLSATLGEMLRHPWRFFRGVRMALKLGRRSDRGVLRHLIYLIEACLLKKICRKNHIEHVHAHFGTNPAAVALLCSVLGGPGYSFTMHGPEEFDRPETLGLDLKVHHARFVAAISSFTRSQLYRWCDRRDWDKISIIRCGLDASLLSPSAEVGLKFRSDSGGLSSHHFVCVGRLAEQKGQLVLLDAMAQLRDAGVKATLTLVGDGPMCAAVEAEIHRLRLQDRVTITGWADGPQVRREILSARVLVLPSFAEGLPVVLMESLALGRPVISTFVAGIPELVTPENGWLVPAGSSTALATAMHAALETDAAKLAEMGSAGAGAVEVQHNAAKEASRLLELIRGHVNTIGLPSAAPVIDTLPVAAEVLTSVR